MLTEGRLFSDIGIAYAKHFAEIEGARKIFDSERKRLLQGLMDLAERACREAQLKPELKPSDDCFDIYLKSKYASTRQALGSRRNSGFEVGFYDWKDFSGLQLLLWFQLSKRSFDALRLPSRTSELSKALKLPGLEPPIHDEGYAYLRVFKSVPDDESFSREIFENEVTHLPKLFQVADGWFAECYKQLQAGGGE